MGVRQLRQGYRIFANDPVDAAAVEHEEGIVEVEGTAKKLERTLSGKYSNISAVAQSWRRERKQEKTDNEGNTKTSWRTVSKGTDAVPFIVHDETGEVAIDPSNANLSITESRRRSNRGIRGQSRRYREYEGRIEPGDTVYVYGQKRTDGGEQDALGDHTYYIGDGDAVEQFVVSDGSELRTVVRFFGLGILLVLVGLIWVPLATIIFLVLLGEAAGIAIF